MKICNGGLLAAFKKLLLYDRTIKEIREVVGAESFVRPKQAKTDKKTKLPIPVYYFDDSDRAIF